MLCSRLRNVAFNLKHIINTVFMETEVLLVALFFLQNFCSFGSSDIFRLVLMHFLSTSQLCVWITENSSGSNQVPTTYSDEEPETAPFSNHNPPQRALHSESYVHLFFPLYYIRKDQVRTNLRNQWTMNFLLTWGPVRRKWKDEEGYNLSCCLWSEFIKLPGRD